LWLLLLLLVVLVVQCVAGGGQEEDRRAALSDATLQAMAANDGRSVFSWKHCSTWRLRMLNGKVQLTIHFIVEVQLHVPATTFGA
jgi:hypothetical protein